MGKVYRLHVAGSNNITGWGSSQYNQNVIKGIQDPQGATSEKPITSIPSPFAIIDLVKTAFKEVASGAKVKGPGYLLWGADLNHPKGTVYHQMVSDALDVAEIFFNYEKFHDDVNPKNSLVDIIELKVKDLDVNSEPGATLRKYLDQDSQGNDPYNFGKMNSFYMLRYTGPGALSMDIIGATSPATLFFAPANQKVLKKVTPHIFFANGDQPFDADLQPLHWRNKDFVKYIYALAEAKELKRTMPELCDYLTEAQKAADDEMKREINDAIGNANTILDQYNQLGFVCNGQDGKVEIISGVPFHSRGQKSICSDFEINSTIYKGAVKPPLVLPSDANSSQYESLYYVQGLWSSVAKVPAKDLQPLDKRILPGDGSKYPYLSKGDFLEDKIIKIPFRDFDSDSFFCGGMTGNDYDFYLLPVKPELFKYFTPKEIIGKGIVKMKRLAGDCVEVELNIPIKGNGSVTTVSFPRNIYSPAETVNLNATMAIEPFVRFNNAAEADYRVALAYMAESKGCSLKFYEAEKVVVADYYDRNPDDKEASLVAYSVRKSNFDFVKLEYGGTSAVIMPDFPKQVQAGRKFKFAIDFGTTNTHVAFNVDGSPSQGKPFTVADGEVSRLLCKNLVQTLQNLLRQEFIPEVIGENFKYPMRTILIWDNKWNWDKNPDVTPGLEANSLLTFNRLNVDSQRNTVGNNLKWATDKAAQYKVRAYIENLFLTLRNKVIAGGGDLAKTEIVWFYPVSMTGSRYNLFKGEWEKAYKKYFGDNSSNNVVSMTESQAPFEAVVYNSGKPAADAATIDIGGGTTDITLVNKGDVECITSFRLASNSLFGRGNAAANRPNGIVQFFKGEYETLLSDGSLGALKGILHSTEASEDLAAFFFSLSSSEAVEEAKLTGKADFVEKLKADGDFKIIFMLFYVAIMWHIASLTKAKGLALPSIVAFSGNGSRILPVITTDEGLLGNLTKAIFEKVFDGSDVEKMPQSIEVKGLGSEQPKEQTCQGGLMTSNILDYAQANAKKTILLYKDKTTTANDETKYSTICDGQGTLFEETVDAVADDFIKMGASLADLSKKCRFTDNFGISKDAIAQASKMCTDKVMVKSTIKNVVKGKFKNHEIDADQDIEETLFFFPLSDIFYDLAAAIGKQKANQPKE